MNLAVAKSEIEKATGLTGARLLAHQRRKKFLVDLVSSLAGKEARILDVGCATGDVTIELALLGYEVRGIDREPVRLKAGTALAASYGRDIRLENKSLEDLERKEFYDIIILGEVLEHFAEPSRILGKLKKVLKEEGKVVITTPNMPSLRNRLAFSLFGVFPDNNPEHKFYFDLRRLTEILNRSGFRLLHFKTRFANISNKNPLWWHFENLVLKWFPLLFPKSGDTILAVITPKT